MPKPLLPRWPIYSTKTGEESEPSIPITTALLAKHDITVSMSRSGDCYDNAIMESFWGSLKAECAFAPFPTRAAARLALFDYLEVWYNRQRLHSALGYTSPASFERQHALAFR